MKKLILSTMAASVFAFNVQADVITFDPAADGSTTMQIDSVSMQINGGTTYEVQQYFHGGADDTKLDEGDLFTESFVYNFTQASLDGTATGTWIPALTADQLTFEFSLAGHIADVTYGAGGAPTIGDPDFASDFADVAFKTVFSSSASAPGTGMTVKYNGSVIGEFDILAGISTDPVELDGSTVGFAITFDFNDVWRNANSNGVNGLFERVWAHEDGTAFTLAEDFNFALAQGSAGPTGNSFDNTGAFGPLHTDGGTIAGKTYFSVEVDDNGADLAFNVPEPTTLAILGLGLLGFAGTRRRS